MATVLLHKVVASWPHEFDLAIKRALDAQPHNQPIDPARVSKRFEHELWLIFGSAKVPVPNNCVEVD